MLFNSLTFLVFFLIVFSIYWAMQRFSYSWQNRLLFAASYLFYGWWDWRFLALIFSSSLVDFLVARWIHHAGEETTRRRLLWVSLGFNLTVLGFFKYFNFFLDSAVTALRSLGYGGDVVSLNIILPVGISFYTFQALSYTIDVYRRKIEPTNDPVALFTYISFFPQLVAGPIERASHLLPQFHRPRVWDEAAARYGLKRILWGLVKKVVVADNLSPFVEAAFNADSGGGIPFVLGTILFGIQIYCDFSAYSDMAIGLARLLGFSLNENFRQPYHAESLQEFWHRWHISLSTWFRDYVYLPLGGSKTTTRRWCINILATFTLSGLWHGAAWTFVAWGLIHGGIYLLESRLAWWLDSGRLHAWCKRFLALTVVFVAWSFFRADSIQELSSLWQTVWSNPQWDRLKLPGGIEWVMVVMAVEWWQRKRTHPLDLDRWPLWIRWAVYYLLIWLIFKEGNFDYQPFIYFQF